MGIQTHHKVYLDRNTPNKETTAAPRATGLPPDTVFAPGSTEKSQFATQPFYSIPRHFFTNFLNFSDHFYK